MAAAAERPSAGGFVLWLHGSGGSGDESRAQVAPYFTASSVRLSFPTSPATTIPCYGTVSAAAAPTNYHPIHPSVRPALWCLLIFPGDQLMIRGPRRTACFFLSRDAALQGCNLLCCFALWLLCKARKWSGGKEIRALSFLWLGCSIRDAAAGDAAITAWFSITEVPITAVWYSVIHQCYSFYKHLLLCTAVSFHLNVILWVRLILLSLKCNFVS